MRPNPTPADQARCREQATATTRRRADPCCFDAPQIDRDDPPRATRTLLRSNSRTKPPRSLACGTSAPPTTVRSQQLGRATGRFRTSDPPGRMVRRRLIYRPLCPLFCRSHRHEPSLPVSPRRRGLVLGPLRRTHTGPGAGLAGDPGGAPRADRRAHRLGQDPGGLPGGDRCVGAPGPGRRAARRDTGGLRLAPEGPVQRYPAQPGGAARRHPRRTPPARPARHRDPHLGPHRRHAPQRAPAHAAPSPAHPRNDPGIPLHPARLRVRPRDAGDHAFGHRGRDPRDGAEQARRPSGAVAGTPGGLVRRQADPHRPLGHAEPDRNDRPPAGRRRAGRHARRRSHHHRHRSSPPARAGPGSAGLAAGIGDVRRGLDAAL